MYASTPTASDIVSPWQPGAFSSGMRAGLAFAQQREQRKATDEARKVSDATKKAFSETMGVLKQNGEIPLPAAIADAVKNNPNANPDILTKAVLEVAPQLTPYQKESIEETKRYHGETIRRYDDDRTARQEHYRALEDNALQGLDLRKQEAERKADDEAMAETERILQGEALGQMRRSIAEKTKAGMDPRQAVRESIPPDLDVNTFYKEGQALSQFMPTREGQKPALDVDSLIATRARLVAELAKPTSDKIELRRQIADIDAKLKSENPQTTNAPASESGENELEKALLELFKSWQDKKSQK